MITALVILLVLSLAANGVLLFRWHAYRSRPSGSHSHTGLMQRITPEMVKADKEQAG